MIHVFPAVRDPQESVGTQLSCEHRAVSKDGRIVCSKIAQGDNTVSPEVCRACPARSVNCSHLRFSLSHSAHVPLVVRFNGRTEIWSDDAPELRFCNAGHPLPYVVGAAGVLALEAPRGKPLGVRPTFTYATTSRQLEVGDCLFLFTDGVTEALDADGQLFSESRLEEVLKSVTEGSTQSVVTATDAPDGAVFVVRGTAPVGAATVLVTDPASRDVGSATVQITFRKRDVTDDDVLDVLERVMVIPPAPNASASFTKSGLLRSSVPQ